MTNSKKSSRIKLKTLSGKLYFAHKHTLEFLDRDIEQEYRIYLARKAFEVYRVLSFSAIFYFAAIEILFKATDYFDSKNNPYAYYLQIPGIIWGLLSYLFTFYLDVNPSALKWMDILMGISCFIYIDWTLVINNAIFAIFDAEVPPNLEWMVLMSYGLAMTFRRRLIPTVISPAITVTLDIILSYTVMNRNWKYMVANRIPCDICILSSIWMFTWFNEYQTRLTFINEKEFENWKLDIRDIDLQQIIGAGTYGEVYKGRWKGNLVAVKKIVLRDEAEDNAENSDQEGGTGCQSMKRKTTSTSFQHSILTLKSKMAEKLKIKIQMNETQKREAEQYEVFEREIRLMCSLRHPNIVTFMGACLQKPNMLLVTEFCELGSLFELLEKPQLKPISLSRKAEFALGSANGLRYLHSAEPPIVHRDFKSLNILVDSNYNVKVCDFGLSEFASNGDEDQLEKSTKNGLNEQPKIVGSISWIAPEIFNRAPHSIKSDIYSLGIVLWEIFSEQHPYLREFEAGILNQDTLICAIVEKSYRPQLSEINEKVLKTLKSLPVLITSCWDGLPEDRPKWEDIIETLENMKSIISSDQSRFDEANETQKFLTKASLDSKVYKSQKVQLNGKGVKASAAII